MAKRGGSKILKRDAEDIAAKLGATIAPKTKHDFAKIRNGDTLVATFGISRSRKAKHGHIPHELKVSETQALRLASCTMTYADYIGVLRAKRLL